MIYIYIYIELWLEFHWSLFLRISTISHYLNQWSPSLLSHICINRPRFRELGRTVSIGMLWIKWFINTPMAKNGIFRKQGKSEGFDSCDRPSNLAQISSKSSIFLSLVTLKFDGWPWKTIGYLFYTTSSFVYHFKSIGELKLKLQSGNAQFGSKSAIFCPVWPWNLMDDLVKQ